MWPSERGRGRAHSPSDIRFDRARQARIEHHSAKGEVVRNVNSFTRGTQLVRLEYMMVWQGVKVPLLTGLASFTILACALMAWRLQTHDIQLVVMRTLSRLWVWCDLSPAKPVNVTLTSGHVLKWPWPMSRFTPMWPLPGAFSCAVYLPPCWARRC
jgi:hypothetical protein